METDFTIRGAKLEDAQNIFKLIHLNSDQLVPKSLGNIIENADRFIVACIGEEIVGCATYQIHPEIGDEKAATVEIQSVAVGIEHRRKGIGKALIEAVIAKTMPIAPAEYIALTFAPEFFGSLGFYEVPKTKVMHKLYTGCINCTKHTNPFTCPEIAMLLPAKR